MMRRGGHDLFDPPKSATPDTPAFVALQHSYHSSRVTSLSTRPVFGFVFLPSSLERNYGTFEYDERYSQSNKAFEKKQDFSNSLDLCIAVPKNF